VEWKHEDYHEQALRLKHRKKNYIFSQAFISLDSEDRIMKEIMKSGKHFKEQGKKVKHVWHLKKMMH